MLMEKDNELKEEYMQKAISLAKMAAGWTNPNPMVGAVVVKEGKIIAEGYHRKCGELHAERDAFTRLSESAEGATIYVTLEPCCHYGKQPPCTEAIVENKIARVVIGSRDPNPLVAGKGVAFLREHGIEVIEDYLKAECDEINPVFFHYITTGKPYVVMKYAMTMDGKIATRTGASKWITGADARAHVHKERSKYSAIMIGSGTLNADNPMLNVRGIENAHQPLRVILDSKLSINLDSEIVKSANDYATVIFHIISDADDSQREKMKLLEASGIKLVLTNAKDSHVNMDEVISWLGENKYDSVYVEGGGRIHEALLRNKLVNRANVYIAPKVFGGAIAKSPVEGLGVELPSEAEEFELKDFEKVGSDIFLDLIRKG